MPQGRASQDTKDPRRRMREGRAPLLETIREAYPPTVLTGKSYSRKHEEGREQLGLLNTTFASSIGPLKATV